MKLTISVVGASGGELPAEVSAVDPGCPTTGHFTSLGGVT